MPLEGDVVLSLIPWSKWHPQARSSAKEAVDPSLYYQNHDDLSETMAIVAADKIASVEPTATSGTLLSGLKLNCPSHLRSSTITASHVMPAPESLAPETGGKDCSDGGQCAATATAATATASTNNAVCNWAAAAELGSGVGAMEQELLLLLLLLVVTGDDRVQI